MGRCQTPTHIDIVIKHPTAASNMRHYSRGVGVSVADAGVVAAAGEGLKCTKYRAEVERLGLEFRAFGLETYGAWGPGAQRVLRQLVAHAESTDSTNTRPAYLWTAPHITEAARQLVAVARMKGIALALLRSATGRRAPSPGLDHGGLSSAFSHLHRSTPPSREGQGGGAGGLGRCAACGPSAGAHAHNHASARTSSPSRSQVPHGGVHGGVQVDDEVRC